MYQYQFGISKNYNQFNHFQYNQMNQTAINPNNIIQNFEKKIKSLKEKIKEQDIQIYDLKKKLEQLSKTISLMKI